MATRDDDDSPVLRAVSEAAAALVKAEEVAKRRREMLLARMVEAANAGKPISHIARRAGYEQAHARRLLRTAGVEPKQPNRVPPPGFKRVPVDAE